MRMDPTAPGVDLTADQVADLLACYGIRVWPSRPVRSEEQAVQAAEELGYPWCSRRPRPGWPIGSTSAASG